VVERSDTTGQREDNSGTPDGVRDSLPTTPGGWAKRYHRL